MKGAHTAANWVFMTTNNSIRSPTCLDLRMDIVNFDSWQMGLLPTTTTLMSLIRVKILVDGLTGGEETIHTIDEL